MAPASDGGAEITRYEYRHAAASDSLPDGWTLVEGGEGARTVTVEQLTNGTTYRFEVRAVNEEGEGTAAATTAAPADADGLSRVGRARPDRGTRAMARPW